MRTSFFCNFASSVKTFLHTATDVRLAEAFGGTDEYCYFLDVVAYCDVESLQIGYQDRCSQCRVGHESLYPRIGQDVFAIGQLRNCSGAHDGCDLDVLQTSGA